MERKRLIRVGIACLFACALVFLALGMWIGGHPADLPTAIQKIFVGENQRVRAQVIDDIQDSFYRKVPKGQLEEASIKGIVQSLHDPFSAYFTPKENKLFAQQLSSKFDGIGTEVAPDRRGLRIQKVYASAPAERSTWRPRRFADLPAPRSA
jgi:C-terminal processing protease CtpA/Prc